MSRILLACAAVSDEDELEGGHVGRGVCGGGGGGHPVVVVVVIAVALSRGVLVRQQRWPRVEKDDFEELLLNGGRKESGVGKGVQK